MNTLIPAKRIEIVIDSLHLPRAIETVEKAGVTSYTITPDAEGRGDRGFRSGEDLVGSDKNSVLLIAVPVENLEKIVVAVRPLLKRYGGLFLVSDAQILPH